MSYNWQIVKKALGCRLLQRTLAFFVLECITHVTYDSFMYYYYLNVLGITQF